MNNYFIKKVYAANLKKYNTYGNEAIASYYTYQKDYGKIEITGPWESPFKYISSIDSSSQQEKFILRNSWSKKEDRRPLDTEFVNWLKRDLPVTKKKKNSSLSKPLEKNSIEDRLGKLKILFEKGLITKKEYEMKRKDIIDNL
jgi:hypothetical protein